MMAAYFTASSRSRGDGHGEQVAQRAEVGLAGDRVAGDHRDGQRQEQAHLDGQRGQRHEQAVVGDRAEEVGGVARRGREAVVLTAIEMKTGTAARTTSPARLRRRRKISRSSERRNRGEGRRTPGRAATRPAVTSAADIESLPGERDEDVLERAGRPRRKPVTESPACTQAETTFSGATEPSRPRRRAGSTRTSVSPSSRMIARRLRGLVGLDARLGLAAAADARRRCPGRPGGRRA